MGDIISLPCFFHKNQVIINYVAHRTIFTGVQVEVLVAEKRTAGPDTADSSAAPEQPKQPSRAEQMRQLFKSGKTRAEVAKEMGVTYQTVFAATRGVDGGGGLSLGRQKIMVTHPETGEEVPRVDLIRELFEKGETRGEIAKKLNTTYQIVYQATKGAEQVTDDDEDYEDEDEDEDGDEDEEEEEEEDEDEEEPTAEELLPPAR